MLKEDNTNCWFYLLNKLMQLLTIKSKYRIIQDSNIGVCFIQITYSVRFVTTEESSHKINNTHTNCVPTFPLDTFRGNDLPRLSS